LQLRCHPVTDDIVCSVILLLVGRRPVNISVASDTSLEIMINADASALAVPAIVLFVHRMSRIPMTASAFRQKLMFAFVKSCRWDQLRADGKIKRVSPLPELRS
jgi:hypothetical protein